MALAPLLPHREPSQERNPAQNEERHDREAERRDLVAADRQGAERLDPAPLAALQDAEDGKAEAESRKRCPDDVELRASLRAGRSLHEPAH
jgi:hypothetical protein